MKPARAVDQLLDKYAESHQNPVNEWIHFVCVPVIMWTVLGLIWAIHPWAAVAAAAVSLAYYFTLSASFAVGMSLMAAAMLGILYVLPPSWVLPVAVGAFVIAWIFQFVGHKIEGKKPSFFDDLRFLLIGPLFVLGFLYRRLKISY
ncbi:MAG: Mpo1-like protein [Pseudomonadota bacterium]